MTGASPKLASTCRRPESQTPDHRTNGPPAHPRLAVDPRTPVPRTWWQKLASPIAARRANDAIPPTRSRLIADRPLAGRRETKKAEASRRPHPTARPRSTHRKAAAALTPGRGPARGGRRIPGAVAPVASSCQSRLVDIDRSPPKPPQRVRSPTHPHPPPPRSTVTSAGKRGPLLPDPPPLGDGDHPGTTPRAGCRQRAGLRGQDTSQAQGGQRAQGTPRG